MRTKHRRRPPIHLESLERRLLASAVTFDRLDHNRPLMASTIYDTAGRRVRPIAPTPPHTPDNENLIPIPSLGGDTKTVQVTLGAPTAKTSIPLGINIDESNSFSQVNTINDLITMGGSFELGNGRILVHVTTANTGLRTLIVDSDWTWGQLGMAAAIGHQLVGSTGANISGSWTITNMTEALDANGNSTGRVAITLAADLFAQAAVGDTFYVALTNDAAIPLADATTGWGNATVVRDNAVAYAGNSSAAFTFGDGPAQNNYKALQYYLSADDTAGRNVLQQGHTYELSFYALSSSAGATATLSFFQGGHGGTETVALIADGKWHRYSLAVTMTTPPVYANGTITVGINGSNQVVHVDVVRMQDLSDVASPGSDLSKQMEDLVKSYGFGTIRFWHASLRFADLDSLIGPADARPMIAEPFSNYDPQFGLPEMLQLCKDTGTIPWIVLPTTWSAQEIHNLMDYLGGSINTVYGAKRAADGHPGSWFDDLKAIRFEAGDESWNGTFGPNSYSDAGVYFARAENMFEAFKSDPLYASVGSRITLIVNGWQWVPYYTQQAVLRVPAADAVDVSAYIAGPTTEMPIDSLLGGVITDHLTQDKSDYPPTIFGKPVFVYESGPGEIIQGLTPATESAYATSLAAGLATAHNAMTLTRDYGISAQNLFTMIQNGVYENGSYVVGHYGIFADMTTADTQPRPTALAAKLLNQASGTVISSTVSAGWTVDSTSTVTDVATTQAADAMVTLDSGKLVITFFNDTIQDDQNTTFHVALPAALGGRTLNLNWAAATFEVLSGPAASSNNENGATVGISNGSYTHGTDELFAALPAHSMASLVIPLS